MTLSIPSPDQGVWHLGPVPLRAYALCIIVGILVAVWLTDRRWKARGGSAGTVGDVAVWAVPFGIVLLSLLIIACMIGMLIQQQELDSFPAYYADLTPAEKIVYGHLGFFDIYHATYFHVLLLLLSLNIILASIDHFPAAWSFISRKKLTASRPSTRRCGSPGSERARSTGSRPRTAMLPRSGCRRPSTHSMVVVLPAPFGPISPKISPWKTSKETSSTAAMGP